MFIFMNKIVEQLAKPEELGSPSFSFSLSRRFFRSFLAPPPLLTRDEVLSVCLTEPELEALARRHLAYHATKKDYLSMRNPLRNPCVCRAVCGGACR
jgi:hypothetical protein